MNRLFPRRRHSASLSQLKRAIGPVTESLESRVLLAAVFAANVEYAAGDMPVSITSNDFNGDGKRDLAIANYNSNTVSVLLGNGAGAFAAKTDFATGSNPTSVISDDFNKDGKLDLAVANATDNTVSVLLGDGNGTFAARIDYATGYHPQSIISGDFNNDGKADLVLANYFGASLSILLGNGEGVFSTKTDVPTGYYPKSVTSGDFNNDGNLDLATANDNDAKVSVLLGSGTGAFAAKTDYATGVWPSSVTSQDLDADGIQDLVVASQNSVSVLLGAGGGSFDAKIDYAAGNTPIGVISGDFDSDGKFDLAAANYYGNSVSLLMGSGNGDFATEIDNAVGSNPFSLVSADFNNDQMPDLAIVNATGNTVSILINQSQGAPTDMILSNNGIVENADSDTTVGTLSAIDPNAGDTFTYSLESGTGGEDNDSFAISGNTLSTNASFDYEAQSTCSILVRVTDNTGRSMVKAFTINISNVNEAPTDLGLTSATVAENQPLATTVGTLSATDPDAGDTFTYALEAGSGGEDNDSFAISGNNLSTNASFDYETQSTCSILVRVIDKNGLSTLKALTINIGNVNETPTDLALAAATVAENQPLATLAGTFSATDPDAGDTFTYSLAAGVGGEDNASFAISGNTLSTNASFDYEAKNTHNLLVRVTDRNGLSILKAFTINISNVNEAPTALALSSAPVAENQPLATLAGTFSATDPDAGDSFTYTLEAGVGGEDNASFAIGGNTLSTNASFDYEAKNTHNLLVRVTDKNGLSTLKAFTISITDVNEAPTALALSSATVAENQPAATLVGTLSATDADAANNFTYSLVFGEGSDDNAHFMVVGNSLQTAGSFDYEAHPTYSIRLRSTDQSGLMLEKAFTVNVTNVNETPTDIRLSNAIVSEAQRSGVLVGTLAATDPDATNTFTYHLVDGEGGEGNFAFTIENNQLRTATAMSFDLRNSYSIRIRSTDQGGLSTDKTFSIAVARVTAQPLIVTGTSAADSVLISMNGEMLSLNVNGSISLHSPGDISLLVVETLDGNDTVTIDSSVMLDCSVLGGDGDDSITGGSGNDTLAGGKGYDTIHGGAGNDRLTGRQQADQIYGGAGDDNILSHRGGDTVNGDEGNDTIDGGWGSDMVYGGLGNDYLITNDAVVGSVDAILSGATFNDTLDGGEGIDNALFDPSMDTLLNIEA